MKNVLQQSLVKLIVGLVAFTCIIASVSIYVENNPYNRSILATCGWNATAKAWIDENKNQEWDENESPLPNVEIFINQNEILNGKTIELKKVGDQAVTNNHGMTEISSLVTCGAHIVFEIYARPPSGYTFTTPEQITLETSPHNKVFVFGFSKK